MNIEAFKTLLSVPTQSYREDQMVSHLRAVTADKAVRFVTDEFKNVYIVKMKGSDPLPCVAAHIDSVQPIRPVQIKEENGIITAEADGRQVGFGADDKTGIQVCLDLLDRFDHIALALFAGEECGCAGAMRASPDFFNLVGYVIEFDCPSRGIVSYSAGGVRLFENGGEFISAAVPELVRHGSTDWQRHPYTDVLAVRRRFPISCLNLSSGYYNWHAPDECVKISDVESAVELGNSLIQALGNRRYTCPHSKTLEESSTPPAFKVGPLRVPWP